MRNIATRARGRVFRRAAGMLAHVRAERGSAVVEFPLVMGVLTLLAMSLVQLALFLHVRNGLTDAAVQGAYVAALEGRTPDDGRERTIELVQSRFGHLVTAEVTATEQAGRIEVTIVTDVPLVGFVGPAHGLTVTGHAIDEDALP